MNATIAAGTPQFLAGNGKTLFLTGGIVQRSDDEGNTWTKVLDNVDSKWRVGPDGNLYRFSGFFQMERSTDGGNTFQAVGVPVPERTGSYAATFKDFSIASNGDVYVSSSKLDSPVNSSVNWYLWRGTSSGMNWAEVVRSPAINGGDGGGSSVLGMMPTAGPSVLSWGLAKQQAGSANRYCRVEVDSASGGKAIFPYGASDAFYGLYGCAAQYPLDEGFVIYSDCALYAFASTDFTGSNDFIHGTRWNALSCLGLNNVRFGGVARNGAGVMMAAFGVRRILNSHDSWLLQRSDDGGATWATADEFSADIDSQPSAVFARSDGRFVVAGYGKDGDTTYWFTRVSP